MIIKSELVSKLAAKQFHISEQDILMAIRLVLEQMSEALSQGDRIEIRGFGSFSLHHRSSYKAHNPRSGTQVITKEKYTPYFKPGKKLRNRVNRARPPVIRY